MKKRWIFGIIVLVVLVMIIICLLSFIGKKEICGPNFLGGGRSISYCDTSCNTESDCKIICGCGAINKEENCDTTGAEVDCIEPGEIKCVKGKCQESVIIDKEDWRRGISISTDKTEYNLREKVNITVESNNLVYEDYPSILIKKKSSDMWEYLPNSCSYRYTCKNDTIFQTTDAPINPYIEFQGQQSIIWKQDYCFYENTTCGNSSYNNGTMKNLTLTSSTRFKAEFCYWNEEDVNTSSYNAKNQSKRKCVETNFTINP